MVSVKWLENAGVSYPKGFKSCGVVAGIKPSGKADLAILYSEKATRTWGVFTKNATTAAPVLLCKKNLTLGNDIRAIVVNSGNANACTGVQGARDAQSMLDTLAAIASIRSDSCLVSSTGIIGRTMPIDLINAAIPEAFAGLQENACNDFAEAILTTDTKAKTIGLSLDTSLGVIKMGGCSKGAGMIHPNMATMLAYVTSDIGLDSNFESEFKAIIDDSFNSITVDGDTSTNDTCIFMSNAASNISYADLTLGEQGAFRQALFDLFAYLAKEIVKDGEGATKFVSLKVEEAKNKTYARNLGRYVANSKLVKTAFFGQDPNWGRLIASIGAFDESVSIDKVCIYIDQYPVLLQGEPAATDLALLEQVMKKPEFAIRVTLGNGNSKAEIWTCDLSYEYVKINAEYTT
jgi:glutamate N-acetyltransferase/amino-acid N-acetyltransferase